MAGKKNDLSIPWIFSPNNVRCNRDQGLLKMIAMLTMLCDHAGKMLFPQYGFMRIIGRMAFPIYAYCLAMGMVYTHDPLRYLKRIVLAALISQPIYAVSLAHTVESMYSVSFETDPVGAAINFYIKSWSGKPSILLTLAMGFLLIWALKNKQIVLFLGLCLSAWLLQNSFDYGIRGLILILLFYVFCDKPIVGLPCILAFMVYWGLNSGSSYSMFGVQFGTQMFAVFALIPIFIPTNTRLCMPKWLGYSFYPLHLVLIYILDKFVM